MWSPPSQSVRSCCTEATRCAWRPRPTCLALSSPRARYGCLRARHVGADQRGHGFRWQRWESAHCTAHGADLLLARMNEQGLAANIGECHGIPLATLHFFPMGFCRLDGCLRASRKRLKAPSAVHSAYPRRPNLRRAWRADRRRSRPMTSSACPGWQPNLRTGHPMCDRWCKVGQVV
jgi:hypothetical protein